MDRGEEYRTKLEVSEMMDRGLTLKEKYGGDKGWRLQLRYDENKPGDIL
jgi:hypothetical protein